MGCSGGRGGVRRTSARRVRCARWQGHGDGDRRRPGDCGRPTARVGPASSRRMQRSSISTCRSSPRMVLLLRSDPVRSTRFCSTPRARGWVRCVVGPTPAGASSRATSPSWPSCRRSCSHRPPNSWRRAVGSSTACARSPQRNPSTIAPLRGSRWIRRRHRSARGDRSSRVGACSHTTPTPTRWC